MYKREDCIPNCSASQGVCCKGKTQATLAKCQKRQKIYIELKKCVYN